MSVELYKLNYKFQRPDDRDVKYYSTRAVLPSFVDLRPEWGDIYDQGELGSCVANSVAGCIRHIVNKQHDSNLSPSRLFLYYNTRTLPSYDVNVDSGVYIRDAFKAVDKWKVCDEGYWRYDIRKFAIRPSNEAYAAANNFKKFVYLTLKSGQIKQCLAEGYPVSFGLHLYSSFHNQLSTLTGQITTPDVHREEFIGGHCMTIVGYNDFTKQYIVANSWSRGWGADGFCFIPYDYINMPSMASDFQTVRYFRGLEK